MKIKADRVVSGLACLIGSLVLLGASQVQAQFWPTPVGSAIHSNPFWTVGRIHEHLHNGNNYIGSGTTVRPYSVLTAGHMIYDGNNGWSVSEEFDLGYDEGDQVTANYVNHLWLVGGYTSHVSHSGSNSSAGFSYDAGAVICNTRPANGGYAGWWQNPALLTGSAYKMSVGYGAEGTYTGELMLRSSPTRAFYHYTGGTGAFYYNTTYRIFHGMSGGPVFAYSGGHWWVAAINVSGSNTNAGVHSVDSSVASLIKSHLY